MRQVAVIMGSASDWDTMRHAAATLDELGVSYKAMVVSAHRTPEWMVRFATGARRAGYRCIIAGAGGAAHLPGMVASLTSLPVLGVPVMSRALAGVDSLLSIVQMPAGVPTATFAIGPAGATNAALFAARMLALEDAVLEARLAEYRDAAANKARASTAELTLPAAEVPAVSGRKRSGESGAEQVRPERETVEVQAVSRGRRARGSARRG